MRSVNIARRTGFGVRVLAYAVAVLIATMAGSVLQTQVNLAVLTASGLAVPAGTRLAATLHDLRYFAPLFALLVAPLLAAGFGIARLLRRPLGDTHAWLMLVMPAILMLAMLVAIVMHPAVPAVIAAARGAVGMLLLSLAMVAGSAAYRRLTVKGR